MVRSLVRELKKTSEQSAANEKVSWALLSELLERFVVSSRDYGYAQNYLRMLRNSLSREAFSLRY